ncbi:MAG: hypothetical protein VB092_04170 [Oscillospiraceae bacterium]|nr:hypothetical protein [Oscillospiraceae bacterium]
MQTKQQLETVYEGGRKGLIGMAIFTAVNAVLALAGSTWSFLFTAFFPYVAASWADYGYLGMPKLACILLCCVFPVALYVLCWLLSADGRSVWMKTAGALFALDTVYMLYFFFAYTFDPAFILTALFHALVLWQIIAAAAAGKKLARGEYDDTPSPALAVDDSLFGPPAAPVSNAAAQTQAQPEPAVNAQVYRYDAAAAKANRAVRTGRIVAAALLFAALLLVYTVMGAYVADGVLGLPIGATLAVVFGGWAALIALLVWFCVRCRPYTAARSMSYAVTDAGVLYCQRLAGGVGRQTFNDAVLLSEKRDCWVVGYKDAAGRDRKLTVPKAFPGLETYMDALRTQRL